MVCVSVFGHHNAVIGSIDQLRHERLSNYQECPLFWWAKSVVVIVCVYQKSVETRMKTT